MVHITLLTESCNYKLPITRFTGDLTEYRQTGENFDAFSYVDGGD